jgi:hypothetical protein
MGAAAWLVAAAGGCARPPLEIATSAPDSNAAPLGGGDAGAHGDEPLPLDPRSPGWKAGEVYAYGIALRTTIDVGPGAHAFDFDVLGDVEIAALSTSTDEVRLGVQVVGGRIVSRAGKQADFDRFASELNGHPSTFTLSGGRLKELGVPKGMSALVANTYREIAASLQFARPVRPAVQYSADEYDTTGQYVARYERDPAEGWWAKHKDRYRSVLAGAPASESGMQQPVVPEVRASRGRVRLSSDGRPVFVEAHDELALEGAQAPVRTTTDVRIEEKTVRTGSERLPELTAAAAPMDRVSAERPYGPPADVDVLDDSRIRGLTFEQIVARLESAARQDSGPLPETVNGQEPSSEERAPAEAVLSDRSRLFVALAATFRKRPETVSQAVQRIRSKSPASYILVEALGSASSPGAQAALSGLMAASWVDAKLKDRVALVMSRAPRPGKASIDALRAVLDRDAFNAQALYGLGTAARHLRDAGDSVGAREIGELLLNRMRLAKIPPQLVVVLGAITNSGYTPALPSVTALMADGPDEVRVAAVRALQSMRDPTIDETLASHLSSDASSNVRLSAIDAEKVREPTDVFSHALVDAATGAPDPRVRYRAVELLAKWLHRRPDLRAALERVAENDAEANIRSRAQAAL